MDNKAVIIVCDRLIKIAVMENIVLHETKEVIPQIFHLTLVLNPGAAFGLMAGWTWIFIITALLVLFGIIYVQLRFGIRNKLIRLALGMIGGGALGNLLDRIFSGKVIDYFDFRLWPFVFNFADSMIVLGTVLLLICFYRKEQKTGEKT